MSVLFGLVVNLLLIGITLRAIAWVLGWFLADQEVIKSDGHHHPGVLAAERLVVVPRVVVAPARAQCGDVRDGEGLGSLGADARRGPDGADDDRERGAQVGVPVAVLMLGVPGGLYLLGQLPGDSADSRVFRRRLLALVDPTKQGVASFSALVVVLIGLGKTVWNGLAVEGKAATGLRARLLAFGRTKLAPWAGTTIIVVAAVVVLLRWTGGYAIDRDYQEDWTVALILAGIAAAIKVLTDANRTSLHSFYRERLSRAFLVTRKDNGAAVALDYHLRLRYSDWAKPVNGGPQLVIAGVANVSDGDFVPSQRDCVPFVFDAEQIGIVGDRSLPDGGRRVTGDYEREADVLKREVTVPAAMAISGAALSPLTGRVNARTRPVRLLLAVLNARLGVWLPNPYWNNRADPAFPEAHGSFAKVRRYVGSVIDKPGPYRLLREAIGQPSMYDRRIYVTDGGHYDNLGLVEALRREPRAGDRDRRVERRRGPVHRTGRGDRDRPDGPRDPDRHRPVADDPRVEAARRPGLGVRHRHPSAEGRRGEAVQDRDLLREGGAGRSPRLGHRAVRRRAPGLPAADHRRPVLRRMGLRGVPLTRVRTGRIAHRTPSGPGPPGGYFRRRRQRNPVTQWSVKATNCTGPAVKR